MTLSLRIESPEHWHRLRAAHIGGSEVAALFDEHPQMTHYELWHRKAGRIPEPDLSDDERVQWGTVMEPAIAEGVRRKTGWTVRKVHRYHSLRPDLGLGGSVDYEIIGHPKGAAVLEIKTADWLIARHWGSAPPLHYELQVQTYLRLMERGWGVMAVLVGGNDLRLFEYQRRPQTHAIVEARVAAFWASIEAGTPPTPDYSRDHDTIAQLYASTAVGKYLDMSSDARMRDLLAEYETAASTRRKYERETKALRAELLRAIGDAETVVCGDYRLRASGIAATAGTVITADMVGLQLKGRESYRALHVTRKREEQAA